MSARVPCTTGRFERLRSMKIGAPLIILSLASCGVSPAGVEEMSRTISEQLLAAPQTPTVGKREPIKLSKGFAASIAASVKSNEGYRAALAREQEAMSLVGVADSVRRPQFGANAVVGTSREVGVSTTTGVAGGLNLSQLVYDGGESVAGVNRATAEALAARAQRAALANDLALEAAKAWIDSWQLEARLSLLRSRTSEMTTVVDQIERMASTGLLDRADVDSASRQIVDIRLEESRLVADLAEARVRLRRYFGVSPEGLARPAGLVSASEARGFAADWRQAPQLQVRAASVVAAASAVAEAEAALRPRVRLQAGASSPMERRDPSEVSVGFGIEYTFGDGGRRARRLDAARSREASEREQLAEAQITLEAALKSALTRLDGLDRAMPLVAEQIRLSASEAATARSQIATGQSTLRQLIEAEIENYRAHDREIVMQAERQLLLLLVAARTGAFARRVGLEPPATR